MYKVLTAKANIAPSTTDAVLVATVKSKRVVVLGGFAIAAGTATTITFNTKPAGAGVAITSDMPFGINGGVVFPVPQTMPVGEPCGYFETSSGQGLTATTGAGASIGVTVRYVLV